MDSSDRVWTAFWTIVGGVVIAALLTVSSCTKEEAELKFKTAQLCMERNGHWMTSNRTNDSVTKTTYTCQFVR